jgi:hypothetical protein
MVIQGVLILGIGPTNPRMSRTRTKSWPCTQRANSDDGLGVKLSLIEVTVVHMKGLKDVFLGDCWVLGLNCYGKFSTIGFDGGFFLDEHGFL